MKEHINQIKEKEQKLMVLELEWQLFGGRKVIARRRKRGRKVLTA